MNLAFPASLEVELRYYRAAADLFFDGRLSGQLRGVCGRCAEEFMFNLDQPFEFVLIPDPAKAGRKAEELHRDDLALSYYSGDEIDLSPLIAEQVMLGIADATVVWRELPRSVRHLWDQSQW